MPVLCCDGDTLSHTLRDTSRTIEGHARGGPSMSRAGNGHTNVVAAPDGAVREGGKGRGGWAATDMLRAAYRVF